MGLHAVITAIIISPTLKIGVKTVSKGQDKIRNIYQNKIKVYSMTFAKRSKR